MPSTLRLTLYQNLLLVTRILQITFVIRTTTKIIFLLHGNYIKAPIKLDSPRGMDFDEDFDDDIKRELLASYDGLALTVCI